MVKYYLRFPRKEYSSIRLKVQISGARFEYVIPKLQIPVKFWNKRTQRMKFVPTWPEVERINELLDGMSRMVENLIFDARVRIEFLTPEEVRHALRSFEPSSKAEDKEISFIDFFKEYYRARLRSGTYADNTLRKDKLTLIKMQEYNEGNQNRLDWPTMNLETVQHFESWCFNQGYGTNYVAKIMRILKTSLGSNAAREHMEDNTWLSDIKIKHAPTDAVYLRVDELKKISDLNLDLQPQMDLIRDHFLIAAYTGCRYSDIHQIGDHVETLQNGIKIVSIRARKTRGLVSIPLHSEVERILMKYRYNVPLPVRNDIMNTTVKLIAQAAGLDENFTVFHYNGSNVTSKQLKKWEKVTTHTARRSFATNAYLAGVPILSIMKITGHKTNKSFMAYIKMSAKESAINIASHPFFQG